MDLPSLARALDALIDRQRRVGPAGGGDAIGGASETGDVVAGPEAASMSAAVDELAALAAALDALPRSPAPTDGFRAALAARLMAAPAPSTLSAAAEPAAAASIPTAKLTQAFDATLSAMAAGTSRESARAMLGDASLDADVADLLDLAETLFDLPDTPAPRPVFRYALRDALANAPEPRSLRRAAPPLVLRLGHRLWRSTKLMAAAAAAVILFAGAGVTFASANALPGDWLYPVKRTAERAQLWLDGPTGTIRLHLTFADRRLDEAVARPPLAGTTLAEFNREVTEALAAADEAIARRVPRAQVADPLLAWLLGARGQLVAGRPVLPPMAWRGARALLDEAILALDGGRPLAEMQVPRLADPAAILALRVDSAQPWARYAGGAVPLPPPVVADVPLGADERAGGIGRSTRRAASSGADVGPQGAPRSRAATIVPPAGAADGASRLALGPSAPRDVAPPGGAAPKPTSRPAKPSPTPRGADEPATPSGPTSTAEPPVQPTPTEPDPVAPSPTASTEPPASPPPPEPTAAPSATAQPALAADLALACGATNSIEVYQTTHCTLALTPGWSMPDGWDIAWTTTSVNPPDDPELVQVGGARSPEADFTPKIALTGVSKMLVTLRAAVRDPEGHEQAAGRIILFVVPHNHGQVTPEAAP